MGTARIEASASVTTAHWRSPRRWCPRRERGGRRPASDSSSGVSIERPRLGTRSRHRHHRKSTRSRDYTSLVSIKLHTDSGERWVEGTVFEPGNLRLVSVRGIKVEAPLGDTMLIIANDDQPGVIGEVGTILGRHKVNIATFALGRGEKGAVGIVNVDEEAGSPRALDDAMAELRRVPAIREAWVVRLT